LTWINLLERDSSLPKAVYCGVPDNQIAS